MKKTISKAQYLNTLKVNFSPTSQFSVSQASLLVALFHVVTQDPRSFHCVSPPLQSPSLPALGTLYGQVWKWHMSLLPTFRCLELNPMVPPNSK